MFCAGDLWDVKLEASGARNADLDFGLGLVVSVVVLANVTVGVVGRRASEYCFMVSYRQVPQPRLNPIHDLGASSPRVQLVIFPSCPSPLVVERPTLPRVTPRIGHYTQPKQSCRALL